VVVGCLDAEGKTDTLTAMVLLPALGTYDGRLVLDPEPAISCIVHSNMLSSDPQTLTRQAA